MDIESVLVTVYRFAFTEIGSELQKWDPQTRETADHSLPYMLAAALQDGRIDVQTFGEERIRDPALRPLMNRIKIVESPSFSSRYPIEMPCKLEIVSRSGKRFEEEGNYPRGHHKNPLTDAEVNAKFKTQCEGRLSAGRQDAVMDAVWRLGESGAIESIIDSMVIDVA